MPELRVNSGEKVWLWLKMFQGRKGLELTIKAVPEIEEYFKEMSKEKSYSLEELGAKSWYSLDDKPIEVWSYKNRASTERTYSVNYPGYGFDLATEIGSNQHLINMSFLKIKGITEGVRVGVVGVMELPDLRELKDTIGHCTRMFIRDYLTPITLELKVVSRERWE